jgi:hypothetical protein
VCCDASCRQFTQWWHQEPTFCNTTFIPYHKRVLPLCVVSCCVFIWFFMTPSIATKFQYINSL